MHTPSNSVFRALADGTRRAILEQLRAGPLTSGDIAAQFESSWPTISRHLAILRESRLVITERKGQEIYYELNTSILQDVVQHLIGWATPQGKMRRPARKRVIKHQEA